MKLTPPAVSKAARQLLYHRERLPWMQERMNLNNTFLEQFLTMQGTDRAHLPHGYVVERSEVGLYVAQTVNSQGYEQLSLLQEGFAA